MIDAKFFIALSFVIFIGLIGRKISAIISQAMADKIETIDTELKQAAELKKEAVKLRQEQEQLKTENEAKAAELVKNAQISADNLLANAQDNLKNSAQEQLAKADYLIKDLEKRALYELRAQAIDEAVAQFTKELDKNLDQSKVFKNSLAALKEAS